VTVQVTAARDARPRRRPRTLTAGALVLLAALAAIALIEPVSHLLLPFEDPNEGWNAVHALRWMAGGPLYPPRGSWIVNNYPPLWFMLEGALGAAFGDAIFAAGVVSMVAFGAVALLIAAAVRALGGDRLASAAAACGFVAIAACGYDTWVGLAEPQMLAHALMLAGLVLLVRARGRVAAACAALPMVAAVLVKHNVLAIPLASLLWLARYRQPLLVPWLGCALVVGGAAAAAMLAAFGGDMIAGLTYPRVFTLGRLMTNLAQASRLVVVLVAWAALLWARRRHADAPDEAVGFVNCALCAALLEIVVTGGALGVGANVALDLVIAASLALGVMLARIAAWRDVPQRAIMGLRGDVAAALLVLAVTLRAAISLGQLPVAFSQEERAGRVAELADLAAMRDRVAAISGPVACEALSLCVWAGHLSDIDLWKLRHETTLSPTVDAAAVVARIAHGDYAAVLLLGRVDGAGQDGNLPGLFAALVRAYPNRVVTNRMSLFWR
jgi:hypothetical protein